MFLENLLLRSLVNKKLKKKRSTSLKLDNCQRAKASDKDATNFATKNILGTTVMFF